ncbi:Patatin-like phospholipase domain [Trinorchestia longiramus]|nr:Patatin-like phospholipase domain [Trinorchestia longiramus]
MATSSGGRQSVGQWQRLLALVKEYIHLQQKSSSCSSDSLPAHPLVKSAALSEQENAAAVRTLSRCIHRIRAVQASKNLTRDASTHEVQLKSSTRTITLNDAVVKEFLADGCIPVSELNGFVNAPCTTVTTAQQSASVSSVNSQTTQVNTNGTPATSTPTTRKNSHVPTQLPNRSFICDTQPINRSSLGPVRLSIPPPTYSSMRFPRTLSSNSISNENFGKESVGDGQEQSSRSIASGVAASDTTTAVVPTSPETELQRALKIVNSYIPLSLSQINLRFLRSAKEDNTPPKPKWMDNKKDVVSKISVNARTRHLVLGLTLESEGATLRRLCDLSNHLRTYPLTYTAAVKCGGIGRVLRILNATKDKHVALEARNALCLMGYAGPVSGRGLRVLTIDGGGTRGLVAVELLRRLEEQSGKAVHEMFDLICGVSTGAIVAVLVGIHRKSPDECERLYLELSEKIFTQTTLKGATGLVINNSYYDSKAWDAILRENMGESPLLDNVAVNQPKVCLVASHAVRSVTQAYLFRNYVLPHRVASHYSGTSRALLWQAVRASAAAPGYFAEFQLEDKILMDGGILVNNPAAIAVHEARQLWPDASFQCVVSLGTGRFQPVEPAAALVMNWGNKLRSVINSATDTEGVHTILHDLLPGNVYFRFNPHLSDEFALDEIKPERLAIISRDTELYARKNAAKFEEAVAALSLQKTPYHKAQDYIRKAQYLYGFDAN